MPAINLPPDIVLAAIWRISALLLVLIVGWRVRAWHHWPIGLLTVLGISSNVVFVFGDLLLSGLLGVPYVTLIAWVCIRKMQDDPHTLRVLLGSKESAWSKERHDFINEVATLHARLDYCEKQMTERGWTPDEYPPSP